MNASVQLYSLAISAYTIGVKAAAATGNEKARQWLDGRKNSWKTLEEALKNAPAKRIWVHCPSLGEYELALPIIRRLTGEGYFIVLSFFSPSGFNIASQHAQANQAVLMLPVDSVKNAQMWFQMVRPQRVILSKGDVWYHYLAEAKRATIPAFLISARFTVKHFSFPMGLWNRNVLKLLTGIGVQDEYSLKVLKENGLSNGKFTGDVRFDRVLENVATPFENELMSAFTGETFVLVAGSTWPQDEEVLSAMLPFLAENHWKIMIAPHELAESKLDNLRAKFQAVRLSAVNAAQAKAARTLIIDKIGLLKYLYRFGKVAYVGGAFKQGLHNILEPAAYGIPVIFGPNTAGFPEAPALIKSGGAFSISDARQLHSTLMRLVTDDSFRLSSGQNAAKFVAAGSGSAERTLNIMLPYLAK